MIVNSDYKNGLLDGLKSIARLTYRGIYVLDCIDGSFEYVSHNPIFLCGKTPDELQGKKFRLFFDEKVKEDDKEFMNEIFPLAFDFYKELPMEENKYDYTLSYDFHMKSIDEYYVLVNHKLTPIEIGENNVLKKVVCLASISPNEKTGNLIAYKKESNELWKYDIKSKHWIKTKKQQLSSKEKFLLHLCAKGKSSKEIAEQMSISVETVKFHRKKVIEKLGVKNIVEAISYAMVYKLI